MFNNQIYQFINQSFMAKQQEFMELFPKYDTDNDNQINSQQFVSLVTELGIDSLYPGSVTKMIQKMNYNFPDKETLTKDQAKEYFLSFDSTSKHDLWKNKYSMMANAAEVRNKINQNLSNSAAPAAPGVDNVKSEIQKKPQQAQIKILIGQPKAIYTSQVEVDISKIEKQNKPKPFIKLTFTSKTSEMAKALQVLFKQNFATFLTLAANDLSEWTQQLNCFHINSFVNDVTTTFFITTTSQDMIDFLKVLTQQFELTFNAQLFAKAHLKFQFDYDFQKFVKTAQSSFYDIFTKDCKLTLSLKLLNLLNSLRKLLSCEHQQYPNDSVALAFPISFLFLQGVNADIQFQNSDIETYQLETKQQILELLKDVGQLFHKLQGGGMKVYQLLEMIDQTLTVESALGEWNFKVLLRLKNINSVFINLAKVPNQENEVLEQLDNTNAEPVNNNIQDNSFDDSSSNKSYQHKKQSSLKKITLKNQKQSSPKKLKGSISPKKSSCSKKCYSPKKSQLIKQEE